MIDNDRHLKAAKQAVCDSFNRNFRLEGSSHYANVDDFYVVIFSYVLQSWKALVSTDLVGWGIYYEVTYNSDKEEIYVDNYSKSSNECIDAKTLYKQIGYDA